MLWRIKSCNRSNQLFCWAKHSNPDVHSSTSARWLPIKLIPRSSWTKPLFVGFNFHPTRFSRSRVPRLHSTLLARFGRASSPANNRPCHSRALAWLHSVALTLTLQSRFVASLLVKIKSRALSADGEFRASELKPLHNLSVSWESERGGVRVFRSAMIASRGSSSMIVGEPYKCCRGRFIPWRRWSRLCEVQAAFNYGLQ